MSLWVSLENIKNVKCISQGFNSMENFHDQKQVVKEWVYFCYSSNDSSPWNKLGQESGSRSFCKGLIEYCFLIVTIVCSAWFFVEIRTTILGTEPREGSRHSHIDHYLRKYYIGLTAAGSDGCFFSIEVTPLGDSCLCQDDIK